MIPALLIDAWQEHYLQRWSFLKHQHFPTAGQRYLSAPAELPSINVAMGMSLCVCVWTVSLPLIPWSDYSAPARPLTELIFPFALCEGHLQREGRERQEGTNHREGETERIVKQRKREWSKGWASEEEDEEEEKRLLKKEWASLRRERRTEGNRCSTEGMKRR